ncbi:MAG: site-specific integrase, partial [Lawsonibacter sp.]
LRRSEILALSWENVDLKKRRIFVKGAAVPDENNKLVQKRENKNRSSTRYVPIMMDELYDVLEAVNPKAGLLVKYHPNLIRERINRICKRNGLPEVGVHGLRHSFASLAYHLGVPEKITMEIGGWSDNQTMRKIYTHVAKSDVARYETELTNFFKNANKNANELSK